MLNILVLEDQPGWEALLASAVRNSRLPECNVARAATYGEAIRLIEGQEFQVAVLDYVIEHAGLEGPKTGLDVAAELRAANPTSVIILVTMVDPARVEGRCQELGVALVEKGSAELEDDVIREITEGLARWSGR